VDSPESARALPALNIQQRVAGGWDQPPVLLMTGAQSTQMAVVRPSLPGFSSSSLQCDGKQWTIQH